MVDVCRQAKGFTLIELLVVLSIIALLLTLAMPKYFNGVKHSKEVALKQDLSTMRDAIDKYYADNAKYPDSLQDLVNSHYIRAVPVDPVTDTASSWITLPPKDSMKGRVFDIKSGAKGNSSEGKPYSQL